MLTYCKRASVTNWMKTKPRRWIQTLCCTPESADQSLSGADQWEHKVMSESSPCRDKSVSPASEPSRNSNTRYLIQTVQQPDVSDCLGFNHGGPRSRTDVWTSGQESCPVCERFDRKKHIFRVNELSLTERIRSLRSSAGWWRWTDSCSIDGHTSLTENETCAENNNCLIRWTYLIALDGKMVSKLHYSRRKTQSQTIDCSLSRCPSWPETSHQYQM